MKSYKAYKFSFIAIFIENILLHTLSRCMHLSVINKQSSENSARHRSSEKWAEEFLVCVSDLLSPFSSNSGLNSQRISLVRAALSPEAVTRQAKQHRKEVEKESEFSLVEKKSVLLCYVETCCTRIFLFRAQLSALLCCVSAAPSSPRSLQLPPSFIRWCVVCDLMGKSKTTKNGSRN